MLRRAKDLGAYKLGARDGEIGKVKEFYFDDRSWTVCYLVADTGGWLSGRRVLISPYALDPADDAGKVIPVDLTRSPIEKSPTPDTDRPVSRQYESSYYPTTAGQHIGAARSRGGWVPTPCAGALCGPKALLPWTMMIHICAARRT